jgi:hypothetical protein
VNLNDLLQVMDRAAANLAKLDAVWERASPMIPTGPSLGSTREYEDLRRSWTALMPGLPPIDGWRMSAEMPSEDEIGHAYLGYLEIGEPAFAVMDAAEAPGRALDEYRFRLGQARRRAVRERLQELTMTINDLLPMIMRDVARNSQEVITSVDATQVADAISEIERLLGDTISRRGRWGDLYRHMRFSQGHDWHDIVEQDWPSVRADIEAASLSDADPLPVPEIDLGIAASSHPTGGATAKLQWEAIDDDGFERLLFDLLRGLPNYQNVEWLTKTRAPDRGRDLSLERVIADSGGTTRTERVIVQAKHWTTKSVAPADIVTTLAALPLWEPPVIRAPIIATSGRFTADAVGVVEKHNTDGKLPLIEMWPDNRLEVLLARRPDLVAPHGLRPQS